MRRSKLEAYQEILGVLAKKPLSIDMLAYEANMDCIILKQRLDFLIKNKLVKEQTSKKKIVYSITERGLSVIRFLNSEERLKAAVNTIKRMDEVLQRISTISTSLKRNGEKENY
ncbi:MAG: winged helix-turn-helix domain-containing protein [Candidatus Bathyarchaeia archaeon]